MMRYLIVNSAALLFWFSLACAQGSSLRFHGNGVSAPDLDRVKIRIDDPGNSLPGPPADVGATDFTLEFRMKADAAENTGAAVGCGYGISWIYGNIVFDRDRYNQSRKFGLSIAGGYFVWGVSGSWDYTVCGTTNVLDGLWHHVAVQHALDGRMWIWVDGLLDAYDTNGPPGDVSYPDSGVPGNYCGGPCVNSDPFIVLGAEKHDAGAEYPSYSGWMDELRLSTSLRYTENFAPLNSPHIIDGSTAALYHFDEGAGDSIHDELGTSHGVRRFGGTPAGPEWSGDTPFGDVLSTVDDLVIEYRAAENLLRLSWSAVAGADSYRVFFSNVVDFTPPAQGMLLSTVADTMYGDTLAIAPLSARFYRLIAISSP